MEKLLELSLQGYNARQIADMLGLTYEYVRHKIKQVRKKNGISRENHGRATTGCNDNMPKILITPNKPQNKSSVNYENGITTYTDTNIGNAKSKEQIMSEKGLSPQEWEIISYTSNSWEAQGKDNEIVTLSQSKLSVKPKKPEMSFEDIEEFFRTHNFAAKLPIKSLNYNNNGDILEIDTADLHCGLLAWRSETGSDYDLKICSERFLSAIADMVDRSPRQYKKIYFCTLGDVLHIDNDSNTTTNGTLQQADGRFAKIFDFAFDILNTALDRLRKLNAPIEYIYTCGNHDRNVGYMLVKCLQMANPDVKFDISPLPQKSIHFGNVLVGLTHGDFPTKNQGTWLIEDYRKEFGESRFAEIHCGHIHTEAIKIVNGIPIKWLLAQCGNSYWERQMGYRSQRGLQAFVWNEQIGLREQMYYYF